MNNTKIRFFLICLIVTLTMTSIAFFSVMQMATANKAFDFSTFIGGLEDDYPADIVIDSKDNIILAGTTASSDFHTLNAVQSEFGGGFDAFIVKLSSTGELLFATYIGGSGDEGARAVGVDSDDNILLAGFTNSRDFLTTEGSLQENFAGGNRDGDGFVVKISEDGQSMVFSTYIGGSENEHLASLLVDEQDNVIIVGYTSSTDYPVVNAFQDTYGGGENDGFISIISTDGQELLHSTFIGGNRTDGCTSVNIDSLNNIVVTGSTSSTNFPLNNPFQDEYQGGIDTGDAYLTRFNKSLESVAFSTFFGGTDDDIGTGIAVNDMDDIILLGFTSSRDMYTLNALDDTFNGVRDAFITRFNSSGAVVDFSTYLGGVLNELGSDLLINSDSNLAITGRTDSPDLPVTEDAFQEEKNSSTDAYLTILDDHGGSIIYSTFLGGSYGDVGWRFAESSQGNILIAGWTDSTDFPTWNAYQEQLGGKSDCFITSALFQHGSNDTAASFQAFPFFIGLICVIIQNKRRNKRLAR